MGNKSLSVMILIVLLATFFNITVLNAVTEDADPSSQASDNSTIDMTANIQTGSTTRISGVDHIDFDTFSSDTSIMAGSMQEDCIIVEDRIRTESPSLACPTPEPEYWDTSEFMIGTISVELIFVESDGTYDANTEDWSLTEWTNVYNEVLTGISWWCGNPQGPGLTGWLHTSNETTMYEPINRNSTEDHLWISEIMSRRGYTNSSFLDQVIASSNAMRQSDQTDWTWTIFVIDSSNDADGSFANAPSSAYAYSGSACMVLTYDNGAWGITNMDRVAAHETGHIFWATDEYNGFTEYSGYLNAADVEGSNCIMDTNVLTISSGTLKQIGWYDGNSDGVFDIVGTEPDTTLIALGPDFTNSTIVEYSGVATVIPMTNNNPKPWNPGHDVTVAKIQGVSYNVDGSGWIPINATDGAFNETTEAYNFTMYLSEGSHTVLVKACTDWGIWETNYPFDNFTIDRTPPTSNVQSMPSMTNSSSVQITANVNDNFGVLSVVLWYSLDNITYLPYSTLFSPPWQWQFMTSLAAGDGGYGFYTIARDIAGNWEGAPAINDAFCLFDSTPSITTVTVSGNLHADGWYNSSVTVTLTQSDATSGTNCTSYRVDSGTWQTYTVPFVISTNGTHAVDYFSLDIAGNNESGSRSIKIDMTIPTTSSGLAGTLGTNGWYKSTVTVTLTPSDSYSGINYTKYRIDGGSWLTYSTALSVSTNGPHTVDFNSSDLAGNSEMTKSINFKIDKTAPDTVTGLSGTPELTGWYVADVTVTLTATDNVGGGGLNATFYRIGTSGSWLSYSSSLTVSSDDISTVQFYSMDNASNNESMKSITVKIDKTSPILTINQTAGFKATVDYVVISWIGSDATSGISYFEISIDGGAFTSVDMGMSHNFSGLADGTHNVTIKAIDVAGNEVSKTIQFTVETSVSGAGTSDNLMLYGAIVAIIIAIIVAVIVIMMRKKKKP